MSLLLKKYCFYLLRLYKDKFNYVKTEDTCISFKKIDDSNRLDILKYSKLNSGQKIEKRLYDGSIGVVAYCNDNIVGYGFLSSNSKNEFLNFSSCGYLNNFFVDDRYRGKNIYPNILSLLIDESNFEVFYCIVKMDNNASLRGLSKINFVICKNYYFYRFLRLTINRKSLPLKCDLKK